MAKPVAPGATKSSIRTFPRLQTGIATVMAYSHEHDLRAVLHVR